MKPVFPEFSLTPGMNEDLKKELLYVLKVQWEEIKNFTRSEIGASLPPFPAFREGTSDKVKKQIYEVYKGDCDKAWDEALKSIYKQNHNRQRGTQRLLPAFRIFCKPQLSVSQNPKRVKGRRESLTPHAGTSS